MAAPLHPIGCLFHGVRLRAAGDHPRVLAALRSRLCRFPACDPLAADLAFEFRRVPDGVDSLPADRPPAARPIYDLPGSDLLYSDAADQLFINYAGQVRVLCEPTTGRVRASILTEGDEAVGAASRFLFTLCLIEMLKRRQVYSLHAAGFCVNGKGLLLPGESGAGKSTLTLALLRAGFSFMAEDMLFLVSGETGLRALAFPDELYLTEQSTRFFPDLCHLSDRSDSPGEAKRSVRPEEVGNVEVVWQCPPRVVVFPRVAGTERSVLTPLAPTEALLELAPNILLTEAHSSQAHLDALGELVREARCYRLETGRDFDRLPGLLRGLVV